MRTPRTIRRTLAPAALLLLAVALLAALLQLAPVSDAATAEGPDTIPWKGTQELWCSFSNPSPYNNCTNYHPTPALDVGMARGTPIYAAGPGVVAAVQNGCVETAWSCGGAAGNYVAIHHPNGVYSRYLHLTNAVVAMNQAVTRGQLLGYAGATGGVCQPTPCPHLHYDVVDSLITVHRLDPGPLKATVNGQTVTWPQAYRGASSWNQVPYGTMIQNDSYDLPLVELGPAPSANFHPVVPFRALDSRTSTGGWGAPLGHHTSRDLKVTGGSVPETASAVIMNVTVTNAVANSFLTVYPSRTAVPNASNLNFPAGQTIPNLVTVRTGPGGSVAFFNQQGSVDVVADIVGYFDDGTVPGDRFAGLTPTRILDSRDGTGGWAGQLGHNETRDIDVAGVAGVPTDASTVVVNVTVTGAMANSFLKAYPSGAAAPNSSNLNFAAGQTISNLVTTQIGSNGRISLYNQVGAVDVVVDVVGFFGPMVWGGFFHATAPTRVLDNRTGLGSYTTPWTDNLTRPVAVSGVAGIPSGASAVVVNLTATNGTSGSLLTAYPSGSGLPNASNLLFGPGQTIPNLVMVPVGPNGTIDIYNQLGNVDVIADIVGYYAIS